MEGVRGFGFNVVGSGVTKKRSHTARRPRSDPTIFAAHPESWSLSSTPSDNISKGSSEDNIDPDMNSQKKERTLNQCISSASHIKTTGTFTEDDSIRSSKGVLAPANLQSINVNPSKQVNDNISSGQAGMISADGLGSEKKVRRVKLKLGGVTHTLHTKPQDDGTPIHKHSTNSIIEGNTDHVDTPLVSRGNGSLRVREKDISIVALDGQGPVVPKGKMTEGGGMSDKSEAVRKSRRVPKRRVIDGSLDDEDDEEIRFLEKLKSSRSGAGNGFNDEDDEEGSRKKRKISGVLRRDSDRQHNLDPRANKDVKTSKSGKSAADVDYSEEEDLVSDEEPGSKRKKSRSETLDFSGEYRKELTVTTRQRALQTGKDVTNLGGSVIEFPNGLPPAPPRKQKEKLSELDQQLKRAEALQKRRMQVEKANKELEAEAIRKILGQDSSRKKKENQIKKQQEERAQERAANAMKLAPNVVRWTSGPNGTIVTFPYEMGLPAILKQQPQSYPPPREKCAGPTCTNPYKYRCSKTKLPLCSLQCYKAVQVPQQPSSTCQ